MRSRLATAGLFLLASAIALPPAAGAAEPVAPKPLAKLRIVLVGDSTVASYANPPADRPTLTGWGQVLGEFFQEPIEIVNLARSGASSKSYLKSGLWQKALAANGDYIFIQFGHNDQPGKGPERESAADGEFRDNLRRFIHEAGRAGAEPVLVTPVVRRIFVDGKIDNSLRPYAEAMLAIGEEHEVPVIDLNRASVALFDKLGDEGSGDFSPSPSDRSHFSRKGALAIAGLVAEGVRKQIPGLVVYLK